MRLIKLDVIKEVLEKIKSTLKIPNIQKGMKKMITVGIVGGSGYG